MDMKLAHTWAKQDETIDDLQCKGLFIIQKDSSFRYGTDAVLLAAYAGAGRRDRVVDLGTGTGIIPLLLAGRTEVHEITGIEIQRDMADMAARSVKMNKLQDRIRIICGDLKEADIILGKNHFDLVVSNPPYMSAAHGFHCSNEGKAVARHEILCTLDDVVRVASALLKSGGRLAMVHRPERLCDLMYAMRKYKVEPKEMRMVHSRLTAPPSLVLVRGMKDSRPGMKVAQPLAIYNEGNDGSYTNELLEIYAGGTANGGK